MSAHPSHPIINEQEEEAMTFWEHLDVLRSSIIRMLFVVAVTTVVAFFFKDTLFNIVLAPHTNSWEPNHSVCSLSTSDSQSNS